MTILLLAGGLSNEREVSLNSAKSVKAGLIQCGYTVIDFDPADGLEALQQYIGQVDVVFPVLHGKSGEDGEVQLVLENLGLPYVGSNPTTSKVCFNKHEFNRLVYDYGYTIPQSQIVSRQQFDHSDLSKQPFVLKPNDGGSSIDVLIATNPGQVKTAVSSLFDQYQLLLLQELIQGVELTVGILGDEALPVVEIIPPDGETFDYENKYNGKTQELCPPISINREYQALAQQIALDIHRKLKARHFSRTDMIIDKSGAIYVLELNTIPGLTEASLFPKAAKAHGLEMKDLVKQLVNMTISD